MVSRSETNQLNVVKVKTNSKNETFNDVLQSGNKELILNFLRTKNLLKGERGFSYYSLLWMLKDK